MHEKDTQLAYAEKLGICHIIHRALLADFASHNSRDARDEKDSEREDDIFLALAEQAYHDKRKQNARESEQAVVDSHKRRIEEAAEETGHGAEHRADDAAEKDRGRADKERGARADHYAA